MPADKKKPPQQWKVYLALGHPSGTPLLATVAATRAAATYWTQDDDGRMEGFRVKRATLTLDPAPKRGKSNG